jgi:serine/threonine-protein kinase
LGSAGFEKELAIKRILPNRGGDPRHVRQFESEARLTSILVHPGIVQVFQFLRAGDNYLFVMEYVGGPSLFRILAGARERQEPLQAPFAAYLAARVAEALEYAHSKADPVTGRSLEIVHRDISPENILLSPEGFVKVIDFGIAKGRHNSVETTAGVVKGKLSYMSPEQAFGGKIDRRTDIYALGLVLFEMLSLARLPAGGLRPEAAPELLTRADLPEELRTILLRALSAEPERRYPSAGQMGDELRRFLWIRHPHFTPKAFAEMARTLVRG